MPHTFTQHLSTKSRQGQVTLILICVVAFGVDVCNAHASEPQDVTLWGKSVQDVQLALTMTNSVVESGSSIVVRATIKNTSTNTIRLDYTGMPSDFDLILTGGAGKIRHLIPAPIIVHMHVLLSIIPGEQRAWPIPVTFGSDISPGDYTLKAARTFSVTIGGNVDHGTGFGKPGTPRDSYINAGNFTADSNLLKVQVKSHL
jgi:hypothetical protein